MKRGRTTHQLPDSCRPDVVQSVDGFQFEAAAAMVNAIILREKMAFLWKPSLVMQLLWPNGICHEVRYQIMVLLEEMGYTVRYGRHHKVMGGEFTVQQPVGWDDATVLNTKELPSHAGKCSVTYIQVPGTLTEEHEKARIHAMASRISGLFGGAEVMTFKE